MAQNLTTTTDMDMIDQPAPPPRQWGRMVGIGMLAVGVLAAASIAFPHGVAAAGLQTVPDPSSAAQSALDWLKKVWVFVILAEIVALITYVVAYFTQSWIPSLYQTFQGDWVKKAVIIGIAAPVIMGALIAAATSAMGGFK